LRERGHPPMRRPPPGFDDAAEFGKAAQVD
jgi:hypothetical protein